MTLNKQLWLAIILIVLLNSTVNFALLFFSTHDIFKEKLLLKNIDNANSLALVLTQAEKTQTNLELLVAAKFDTGHYALIELTNDLGETVLKYTFEEKQRNFPSWFSEIAQFNIPPGVAQVSDGWNLFGTLKIESQTSYAMEMLWAKFKQFIVSMVVIAISMGIVGSLILGFILKPLRKIVYQANSFSKRRFITIKRPWTTDFAKVVDAMNSLATRFKVIVLENNKRLEEARFRSQHDPVTGLPNINAFFTMLESQLQYRDCDGQNILLIHSIANEHYDVQDILDDSFNSVFKEFSSRVVNFYEENQSLYTDFRASRINETDIAVILTDSAPLDQFAELIQSSEAFSIALLVLKRTATITTAGVYIRADEASFTLMDRLDIRLEHAQKEYGDYAFNFEDIPDDKLQVKKSDWPEIFEQISTTLNVDKVRVLNAKKQTIQYQPTFSCHFEGKERSLSYVTRIARDFSQLESLDLLLLERILDEIKSDQDSVWSLLLYQETLLNPIYLNRIIALVKTHQTEATRLSFELRESSAALHRVEFRHFCAMVKHLGVHLGLKRVGKSFSQVANVHEYGLDYIKIDSAYVYDVKNNITNQTYLRGLCDLAHSLGMDVFADGVLSDEDEAILFTLGFDGVTRLG